MARKHDYAKIREAVGALDFAYVPAREIARRLNEDQVGLGYPVKISLRQVYNYRKAHREKHGPPPGDEFDGSPESIKALAARAAVLIQREISALEKVPAGSLSIKQSRTLREHYRTLDEMRRKAAVGDHGAWRRGKGKPPQSDEADKETTAERIAREMGEG